MWFLFIPITLLQWFPTFVVRRTPTAVSADLIYPFIKTTIYVPNMLIKKKKFKIEWQEQEAIDPLLIHYF